MGCVEGKVAFITGGARGQGRNHALRLAEEGADIVLIDLCSDIDSVGYPLASNAELDETLSGIKARGRRVLARVADVRQRESIETVLAEATAAFGGLDIVCANAGVAAVRRWDETPPELWRDIVDVNLTGVWNSLTAAAPHLIRRGGGSASAGALAAAEDVLRAGKVFGIYPEGTRTRDGFLHRGHTGMARLAMACDVPIVPVGLIGTDAVQPVDSKLPKLFQHVTIRFGEPVDPARYEAQPDDHMRLREITDEVMYDIAQLSGYEYVDTYATKQAEDIPTEPARVLAFADLAS